MEMGMQIGNSGIGRKWNGNGNDFMGMGGNGSSEVIPTHI